MIIQVNIECFNNPNNFQELDKFLYLISSTKHELIITPDEVDSITESTWFNSLGERHQGFSFETFEKFAVNSQYISNTEINSRGITAISDQVEEETIQNRLKLLEDPLYVIVEDIDSDQLFLSRLYEIYKKSGKNVRKAKENNWLTFTHAGGKTHIPKLVADIQKTKPQPYQPRVIVIIDSDKRSPVEPYSNETQRIIDFCNVKSHPIHVYEKRETENYIPDVVLNKRIPGELSDTVTAFCKMNAIQKDFYDLEKGFQSHRPIPQDPYYGNYAVDEDYHHLRYGFHQGDFRAKKEIYKFVVDEDFNQENIKIRCLHQHDPNELKTVLKKIENLL